MTVYLAREGYKRSPATVHKYMNKELKLRSIVRRKKPGYEHGQAHRVFDNLLEQNFDVEKPNMVWCTGFTYLYLRNNDVRFNRTIIDLCERSVIAQESSYSTAIRVRSLRQRLSSSIVNRSTSRKA